jgi:SAM-dependent methyltransferase
MPGRGARKPAPREPAAPRRLLRALRAALEAVDYSEGRFERCLGASISERIADPAVDVHRLAGKRAFETLARLFYAGTAVPARSLGAAIGQLDVADLQRGGLVETSGDLVRARIRIEPHRHLLIASDRLDYERADHVIGVDPSATRTARLTATRNADAMLDLGTGGGLHALLAARRSDRVLGVDVNPRALAFAAINEGLNAIENVSWLEGSWFEPVGVETFDLIVANLPFAISPDTSLLFRDSELPGDSLVPMVLHEAAARLTDGGIAQVLCNWVNRPGDDWAAPLREWVAGTGADALLLHTGTVDAATYAGLWNARAGPESRQASVERWLRHYEASGIEAIAGGMVVLRRRDAGAHWVAPLEIGAAVSDGAGDHVLRLVEAQDFLARVQDSRTLLSEAFALVDGQAIEQSMTYEGGRHRRHPAVLRALAGIGVEVEVGADALDVVFGCDGCRSLGAVATAVAAESGQSPEEMAATALDVTRRLYERGLLVRVDNR